MPLKKYGRYTFNLVIIILLGMLLCAHFIVLYESREIPSPDSVPLDISIVHQKQEELDLQIPTKIIISQNQLTRKTRLGSRHGLYLTSIFYDGDHVVARQKESGGKAYDLQGQIPDGEFTFENFATQTSGIEHYENGQRHGEYKEYFSTGQLKLEAQYVYGKFMQKKEYYPNGTLRRIEDYTDALFVDGHREAGVGQVYNKEGRLTYEWHFTVSENGGFNRSYGDNGEIVQKNFFDAQGNLKGAENEMSSSE